MTDDLRTVAGKAVADPAFRQALLADPEKAIKDAGIQLSPEDLKTLKEMDKEQLEKGLTQLDDRLTMRCWGKVTFCAWV